MTIPLIIWNVWLNCSDSFGLVSGYVGILVVGTHCETQLDIFDSNAQTYLQSTLVRFTANLCERHTHLLIVSLQQISLATLELLLKLLRFRLREAPVRSSLLQTKTETQSGEETEDETSEEQDQNKQTKKDTKTPWNHRTTLHIHYGIFIT